MIVPMKKVSVLTQSKDADLTIRRLRKLGILHVEHQKPPEEKNMDILESAIILVDKAINILKEVRRENSGLKKIKKHKNDKRPKAGHVVDLHNRITRLEEYLRINKNKVIEWKAWGDFDPEKIRELAGQNVRIRLYSVPAKNVKDFPENCVVKKISAKKGMANIAVISLREIEAPFKELTLPEDSIRRIKARITEDEKIIKAIKEDLKNCVCYIDDFIEIRNISYCELEFQKTLNGMGQSGNIVYLTGFIPRDAVNILLQNAKKEKWGVSVKDPSPSDNVPTLIRNPKWVSIIEPIFKIIEIVPGYRELDISLWFLVFLSIFFGILVGDAGYGAVFVVATLAGQKKFGKKTPNKGIFTLFYAFSICAIIWGFLTGTFFGQEWLPESVKPLLPALRNSKNIQALCFLIGTIHLSIAHLWRAILKAPSPKALADAGWISVLWGAFFLAKTLILGEDFPVFARWFFVAGPIMIVIFTNLNLNRNILKGIGSGFGNLLSNFVNSFTDVVSYIRLFAVGLATVAIADAFNKMALGIGFNSFLTGLATALILLLGHTLNILLGGLAVVVHGVRLNVLEFCNHIDITWSGFSYKPLKEREERV